MGFLDFILDLILVSVFAKDRSQPIEKNMERSCHYRLLYLAVHVSSLWNHRRFVYW